MCVLIKHHTFQSLQSFKLNNLNKYTKPEISPKLQWAFLNVDFAPKANLEIRVCIKQSMPLAKPEYITKHTTLEEVSGHRTSPNI